MTYKEFARHMAAWEQFGEEAQAKVLGGTYPRLYKLWLDRVGHSSAYLGPVNA